MLEVTGTVTSAASGMTGDKGSYIMLKLDKFSYCVTAYSAPRIDVGERVKIYSNRPWEQMAAFGGSVFPDRIDILDRRGRTKFSWFKSHTEANKHMDS